MTTQSWLYSLSISAVFVVVLWFYSQRYRSTASRGAVTAAPEPLPTPSGLLGDISERLRELEIDLKAHKRDNEDFEEQVRRWQGRINKQAARDGAAAEPTAVDPDDKQIPLFGAPITPAASAAGGHRGPRLTRSQLMTGRGA